MDSRVNKYNDGNEMSRVSKNEKLYEKINDEKLDNFSVRSNATVIGNQEQDIDIEKIKKILDKRYNETPKRKSIRVEPRVNENTLISEEATKEYDLNVVLEKAREEKIETYEESRAKKLRNTQFDILNNLQINDEKPDDIKDGSKKTEDELIELINTITINEAKDKENEECNPLDILEDLRGSDNTAVYETMAQDLNNLNEEINSSDKSKDNKKDIDESFYTNNLFKNKDFEDDNSDLIDDGKLNIGIKVLIVLVVICFLVGIFLFLKSFIGF